MSENKPVNGYADVRAQGEWFNLTPEDLISIQSIPNYVSEHSDLPPIFCERLAVNRRPKMVEASVRCEPEIKGKQISYRANPELRRLLNDHVNSFEYPPSYSDILDDALAAHLKVLGFKVPDIAAERKRRADD